MNTGRSFPPLRGRRWGSRVQSPTLVLTQRVTLPSYSVWRHREGETFSLTFHTSKCSLGFGTKSRMISQVELSGILASQKNSCSRTFSGEPNVLLQLYSEQKQSQDPRNLFFYPTFCYNKANTSILDILYEKIGYSTLFYIEHSVTEAVTETVCLTQA